MSNATETLLSASASDHENSMEQRARDWWRITISDAEGDRGLRARLRRCATPLDAVGIPAAIGLARRLGRVPDESAPAWKHRAFERALGLAIVLAGVRVDSGIPLMRSLGWGVFPYDKKENDAGVVPPILSELRFRRFLQTEGEDELIAGFMRLISWAGGETDVTNLSRVFLRWDDDRTKRDLALVYFRANARGLEN
jgi:CRISPR type I-E-associated protein CasB/Cse2